MVFVTRVFLLDKDPFSKEEIDFSDDKVTSGSIIFRKPAIKYEGNYSITIKATRDDSISKEIRVFGKSKMSIKVC